MNSRTEQEKQIKELQDTRNELIAQLEQAKESNIVESISFLEEEVRKLNDALKQKLLLLNNPSSPSSSHRYVNNQASSSAADEELARRLQAKEDEEYHNYLQNNSNTNSSSRASSSHRHVKNQASSSAADAALARRLQAEELARGPHNGDAEGQQLIEADEDEQAQQVANQSFNNEYDQTRANQITDEEFESKVVLGLRQYFLKDGISYIGDDEDFRKLEYNKKEKILQCLLSWYTTPSNSYHYCIDNLHFDDIKSIFKNIYEILLMPINQAIRKMLNNERLTTDVISQYEWKFRCVMVKYLLIFQEQEIKNKSKDDKKITVAAAGSSSSSLGSGKDEKDRYEEMGVSTTDLSSSSSRSQKDERNSDEEIEIPTAGQSLSGNKKDEKHSNVAAELVPHKNYYSSLLVFSPYPAEVGSLAKEMLQRLEFLLNSQPQLTPEDILDFLEEVKNPQGFFAVIHQQDNIAVPGEKSPNSTSSANSSELGCKKGYIHAAMGILKKAYFKAYLKKDESGDPSAKKMFLQRLESFLNDNQQPLTREDILDLFEEIKKPQGDYAFIHKQKNKNWDRFRLFFKSERNSGEQNFWHTHTYQQAVGMLKRAYFKIGNPVPVDRQGQENRFIDYFRGNAPVLFHAYTTTAHAYRK